jgi:hypothetical protein
MDENQRAQTVDYLHTAELALIELGGRLPDEGDEVNARGAYDRVVSAVESALTIIDPH